MLSEIVDLLTIVLCSWLAMEGVTIINSFYSRIVDLYVEVIWQMKIELQQNISKKLIVGAFYNMAAVSISSLQKVFAFDQVQEFVETIRCTYPDMVGRVEQIFSITIPILKELREDDRDATIRQIFCEKLSLQYVDQIIALVGKIVQRAILHENEQLVHQAAISDDIQEWRKISDSIERKFIDAEQEVVLFSWTTFFAMFYPGTVADRSYFALGPGTRKEELFLLKSIFKIPQEPEHPDLRGIFSDMAQSFLFAFQSKSLSFIEKAICDEEWVYCFLKMAYYNWVFRFFYEKVKDSLEEMQTPTISSFFEILAKNSEIISFLKLLKCARSQSMEMIHGTSKELQKNFHMMFLLWFSTARLSVFLNYTYDSALFCRSVFDGLLARMAHSMVNTVYGLEWKNEIGFLAPAYPVQFFDKCSFHAHIVLDLKNGHYIKLRNILVSPVLYEDVEKIREERFHGWFLLGMVYPGSLKISLSHLEQAILGLDAYMAKGEEDLAYIRGVCNDFLEMLNEKNVRCMSVVNVEQIPRALYKISVNKSAEGVFQIVSRKRVVCGTYKKISKDLLVWAMRQEVPPYSSLVRAKPILWKKIKQSVYAKGWLKSIQEGVVPTLSVKNGMFFSKIPIEQFREENRLLELEIRRGEFLLAAKVPHVSHLRCTYGNGLAKVRGEMVFYPSKSFSHFFLKHIEVPVVQKRGFFFRYLIHIAESLSAIHELNLVHNDVKLSNILIDSIKDEALLADFASLRLQKGGKSHELFPDRGLPGTFPAPEYIGDSAVLSETDKKSADFFVQATTSKNDCWAFGLMLYAVFHGEEAFSFVNKNMTWHQNKKGLLQALETVLQQCNIEDQIDVVVKQLLEVNPSLRISMSVARMSLQQIYKKEFQ